MAWSRVQPTYDSTGRRAYDYSCTCGQAGNEPVLTPGEADRQRDGHMRTAHPQ